LDLAEVLAFVQPGQQQGGDVLAAAAAPDWAVAVGILDPPGAEGGLDAVGSAAGALAGRLEGVALAAGVEDVAGAGVVIAAAVAGSADPGTDGLVGDAGSGHGEPSRRRGSRSDSGIARHSSCQTLDYRGGTRGYARACPSSSTTPRRRSRLAHRAVRLAPRARREPPLPGSQGLSTPAHRQTPRGLGSWLSACLTPACWFPHRASRPVS